MMMMKSVIWWRKPEYPEEATDLRQVTDETFHTYGLCPVRGLNLGRSGVKQRELRLMRAAPLLTELPRSHIYYFLYHLYILLYLFINWAIPR